MTRQRDSAHSAQWSSRTWNQDAGRVAWWVCQAQRSGTHLAKEAAKLFFAMLIDDFSLIEATRLLAEQGIAEIPAWLCVDDIHAPIPAEPVQMTFFATLEMETP